MFAWFLGNELLPFVIDGSLVLVFVLCFFLYCYVFYVENRVCVGLAFLVSCYIVFVFQ